MLNWKFLRSYLGHIENLPVLIYIGRPGSVKSLQGGFPPPWGKRDRKKARKKEIKKESKKERERKKARKKEGKKQREKESERETKKEGLKRERERGDPGYLSDSAVSRLLFSVFRVRFTRAAASCLPFGFAKFEVSQNLTILLY